MLDIQLFRNEPQRVAEKLKAKKADPAIVDKVLELDTQRRDLTHGVEQLKKERNENSKKVGEMVKSGGDAEPIKARMREVGDEIAAIDKQLDEINHVIHTMLLSIPNLPHDSAPIGKGEDDNIYLRESGAKPAYNYAVKPHWDVAADLGILDAERAAILSGSGFFLLKGQGAKLQRSLINFMLDMHIDMHGYTEVRVPYVVNRWTMTGTGQLPKLEFDMYRIEADDLFLKIRARADFKVFLNTGGPNFDVIAFCGGKGHVTRA